MRLCWCIGYPPSWEIVLLLFDILVCIISFHIEHEYHERRLEEEDERAPCERVFNLWNDKRHQKLRNWQVWNEDWRSFILVNELILLKHVFMYRLLVSLLSVIITSNKWFNDRMKCEDSDQVTGREVGSESTIYFQVGELKIIGSLSSVVTWEVPIINLRKTSHERCAHAL